MKAWLLSLLLVLGLAACSMTGGRPAVTDEGEGVEEAEPADTLTAEEEAEEEFEELVSEQPMPVSAEELFDDFLFNFASNRRLQLERIAFPLLVNSGQKVDTIRKADWEMEHFFMHQGEYTLIFDSEEQMELVKSTDVSEAIVEKIFLSDAFVRQYLFSRRNGRWMLNEIRNQTLPRNPNASFLEFYQQFVSDSVFQHESLSEEIDFVGPDPDDDFAQMEGVITPDFWDAFAPELPSRIIYNVVYGQQDADAHMKIFVIRGISNGQEIEVTFVRRNGRWKLKKLVE
ncbi:MAG: DUF4348 domain-containing protein [Prevotella sp.]|nr:DUF4348 domain-containing protein [Prevotella sp.]